MSERAKQHYYCCKCQSHGHTADTCLTGNEEKAKQIVTYHHAPDKGVRYILRQKIADAFDLKDKNMDELKAHNDALSTELTLIIGWIQASKILIDKIPKHLQPGKLIERAQNVMSRMC